MGLLAMGVSLTACGTKEVKSNKEIKKTQTETRVKQTLEKSESIEKSEKVAKSKSKEETQESTVDSKELEATSSDTKSLTKEQVMEWVRAVVDVNVKPDSEMANYKLRFEEMGNGDGLTYVAVGPPEGVQIDNTLAIYRLNGEGKLQQAQGLGPMAEWKTISEEFMDTSKIEVIKREAKKEKVDTKSLTNDQAIDWVKHYLVQNGATIEELNEEVGFKADMVDGYLQVSEYHQNTPFGSRTLSYIYRINAEGELEEGSIYNSDDWHVISTEYID